MRNRILIAALVLFAAACTPPSAPNAESPQEAPQAQAADTGKPGAAPPAQPTANTGKPSDAAPARAAALTPAMFVGRWGDNGDCTNDIVFRQDGTFSSYTGSQGTWRLDRDMMTMSGAGGTFQVRVQIIDGNRLMIFNPDGSVGTSQRC